MAGSEGRWEDSYLVTSNPSVQEVVSYTDGFDDIEWGYGSLEGKKGSYYDLLNVVGDITDNEKRHDAQNWARGLLQEGILTEVGATL